MSGGPTQAVQSPSGGLAHVATVPLRRAADCMAVVDLVSTGGPRSAATRGVASGCERLNWLRRHVVGGGWMPVRSMQSRGVDSGLRRHAFRQVLSPNGRRPNCRPRRSTVSEAELWSTDQPGRAEPTPSPTRVVERHDRAGAAGAMPSVTSSHLDAPVAITSTPDGLKGEGGCTVQPPVHKAG